MCLCKLVCDSIIADIGGYGRTHWFYDGFITQQFYDALSAFRDPRDYCRDDDICQSLGGKED